MKVKDLIKKLKEFDSNKEIRRFNISEYGQEYIVISGIYEQEGKIIIN
ncbi:MAG: hypothetical protein K9K32_07620 [Halanaerobiales bacterium]|nr:hypothetical protein [Halanaerobiales bacterium]